MQFPYVEHLYVYIKMQKFQISIQDFNNQLFMADWFAIRF